MLFTTHLYRLPKPVLEVMGRTDLIKENAEHNLFDSDEEAVAALTLR